jgi:phage head maturation protease
VSSPAYLLPAPEDYLVRIEPPPRIRYRAVESASYTLSGNGTMAAGNGLTLSGTFAVFDAWTEIKNPAEGHFLERVGSSAFAKTIRENPDLPVLYGHGKDPVLGSQVLGKIRSLRETASGVDYTVDLFDGLPELLLEGLRAGVYGASFRGKVVKEQFSPRPGRSRHNPEGIPESVISELQLKEFGPTSIPAYPTTSAKVRSISDQFMPRLELVSPRRAAREREPVQADWFLEAREERKCRK